MHGREKTLAGVRMGAFERLVHSSTKRIAQPLDVGGIRSGDRHRPSLAKEVSGAQLEAERRRNQKGKSGLARVGAEWVAHLHQKMLRRNMCEDANKHAHCSLSDYLR